MWMGQPVKTMENGGLVGPLPSFSCSGPYLPCFVVEVWGFWTL